MKIFFKSLNLINGFFILVLFPSCNNQNSQKNTSVTFKLPVLNSKSNSQLSSKTVENNLFAYGIDDGTNSTENETSTNNGYLPETINKINCYSIMVSGPDEYLKKSYCPIKAFTTASGVSTSSTVRKQQFGIWIGKVYQGKEISFDVPPGNDRVFYLIGYEASDESQCVDFNADYDKSKVSEPYIIGVSKPIKLEAGGQAVVPISIASSGTVLATSHQFIDTPNCTINNSTTNVDTNSIFSQISIEKISFPMGKLIHNNNCNFITLKFRDQNGRPMALTSNDTLKMTAYYSTDGTNAVASSTFKYYANDGCYGTSFTTSTDSINVPTGATEQKISFYTNEYRTDIKYGFKFESRLLNYLSFGSGPMLNANTSSGTTQVIGPIKILPNTCYEYKIVEKNINGRLISTNTSFTLLNISSSDFNFYSDSNCSTTLTSSFLSETYTPTQNLYGKFKSTVSTSAVSFTTSSDNGDKTLNTQKIFLGGGSTSFQNLKIQQPEYVTLTNNDDRCFGPYFASFENNEGTSINLNSATINISSSDATNIQLKETCSCNAYGTPYMSTLGSNIAISNKSGVGYYIYMPGSATAGTNLEVTGTITVNATIQGQSAPIIRQKEIKFTVRP